MPEKTEKRKPIKVFVATPAYDGRVLTDYAISIAETGQVATLCGINMTATVLGNGAFIDLARNAFCKMFLESDATHLFFIDADLKWEPRAFVALAQAGLPVVAGCYPKRQDPEEYPVRYEPHPETKGLWVDQGFIMCSRVPTGFLCIERKVIEEMWWAAKPIKVVNQPEMRQLFYTYVNEDGDFVGEDFAWCKDYVERYKRFIPVWPDFDFTHGARWKGNLHEFLLKKTAEEEREKSSLSEAIAGSKMPALPVLEAA